jgi:hypothetical protein
MSGGLKGQQSRRLDGRVIEMTGRTTIKSNGRAANEITYHMLTVLFINSELNAFLDVVVVAGVFS